MRRVLVYTFGCKLNQYDSQVISESFVSQGYESARDLLGADVCVVNTCSVTARSDYEARQLIRRVHRANPGALILVTGCYAERAPDEVARVTGAKVVAGNSEKNSLPRFVEGLLGSARSEQPSSVPSKSEAKDADCLCFQPSAEFQRRSRALLKIQDGCDGSCSYCVVPSVRGRSRSVSLETIQKQVKTLENSGFNEVVLTGARIGSYGRDLGKSVSLDGLLKALLEATNKARFRLSSLEPLEIGNSLLDLLAHEERICRHFHVPLQSGDEGILRTMGRPYTPNQYVEKIESIHRLS